MRELLDRHRAFAFASSPREHVHALDVAGLVQPGVTFFSARDGEGRVLGIGALKALATDGGEIKSMHTAEAARRAGVGGAMLAHIVGAACGRGYSRLSLETGTGELFAAAQALYARAGFTVCEPFGEYTSNPFSVCMTMVLT
ncbi:MAG: GNAT family N-acetyltransferase [Candidatus Dormibacteria bacterium]